MTRVLSGLQSSCLRNRCLDRSSALRNWPWNRTHPHRRGHHHTSVHGKSPSLHQSLGPQLTIIMQQCHLSTTVTLTLSALIPFSLKPLVKTICLIANIYILQKFKFNNEHGEKRRIFTPKSLVDNKQRKFRKIWLTNRPLFYGAIVSSTLNILYWAHEANNSWSFFLKAIRRLNKVIWHNFHRLHKINKKLLTLK